LNILEEYLQHIEIVLKKLNKHFKLNKDECEFMKNVLNFLRHIFNEIKAKINEIRLAIKNCAPKNKRQLHTFLDLINWDRRFVKNLAFNVTVRESIKKEC